MPDWLSSIRNLVWTSVVSAVSGTTSVVIAVAGADSKIVYSLAALGVSFAVLSIRQ